MVDEAKFSAVLSDFAWTLATDFPIQSILDHLVERIVEVLPVTSAGVTLISEERLPRYIASSDSSALCYEQLQTRLGQGPCLTAYNSGEPVAVPDLDLEDRFSRFTHAATSAGLAAVFAFPLRHGSGRFGALDLYRDTPGDLSTRDMDVARTLADVTAAYLLNAQAREDARTSAEHFEHIALHDGLTGLPNRLLLRERLTHAAQRATRSHTHAAVLFVDLNRFKRINDTYGHHVGDELLLAVARRLSPLVRAGDTLARVCGDEFVFLCEDLSAPEDAELITGRVHEAFTRPFQLAGFEINVSASVGMAFVGPGELISEDLVAEADMAMYQAKRKGDGTPRVLDQGGAGRDVAYARLEADLRRALQRDRLEVAYQPVVRTADGRVTGVEALLRWTHPERGAMPPAVAVRLAEQSGLIGAIGAWVLERSCRDRAEWLRQRPEAPLDIAVNVSASQLVDEEFRLCVARMLASTGMDPAALVLEVTENVLIDDTERAVEALGKLKGCGVRVALDDFGSGFSSLSYLGRLPIDLVKIDASFIADVGQGGPGGAIAAAVTELAHALGLEVVAEGVETLAQCEGVRLMGCGFAQGYYYAHPMSAAAISEIETTLPVRRPTEPARPAQGATGRKLAR